MKYSVKDFRAVGLEARWGRTGNRTPCIFVRNPNSKLQHQRETWWIVDNAMFNSAQKVGILSAFDSHTLLGNFFSISA